VKQENKDSMAPIAMIFGVVVLLAAVIFLVTRLVSVYEQNSTKGEINNEAQVLANIQPIGEVATGEVAAPAARSGKEVVDAVCASCHGAGVLGAPKIGDNGQWSGRFANGLDGLIKTATSGIGAMPAMGGDPTLSEDELADSIIYMLNESGISAKKK
jgi:cytochrome c5